jgi:hypothetical protein
MLDTPEQETPTSQTTAGGVRMVQTPADPNNPKDRRRRKTPWWEKAAVIIAIGLLLANWYQGCQTKKAAEAAINAANTAQKTLVVSERPWVGFAEKKFLMNGVKVYPDATPGHEGRVVVNISASAALENFGHSPALHVSPLTFFATFANESNGDAPKNWQILPCQSAADKISKTPDYGYFILPGSTVDTTANDMQGTSYSVAEMHTLWIVGCIVYQDSIGGEIHHTAVLLRSPYAPNVAIPLQAVGIQASTAD